MAACHALHTPLTLVYLTPYTDSLTPQYNPFCPRVRVLHTILPSIEVTLEKSVRGALKRNVGIATEQPLLPVSPRLDNARFDQEMAGYLGHPVTVLVWENIYH